uniref:Bm4818, isoform b n=1 Tax=Brugia malayi TaxID=6279 RepID=A0A1I9G138_BRUMA|nr:Bm4818, isoform b [Brugia malayi]
MQKKRAEAQRQRSNRFLSALLAANAPFYHSLRPFRMQTCRVICKHDKTRKHKPLNRLMVEPPTNDIVLTPTVYHREQPGV